MCLLVGGTATAEHTDSDAADQSAVAGSVSPSVPPPSLQSSEDVRGTTLQRSAGTQADFNAEELTILTQLDTALSQRQTALDAQRSALAAATDPAVKRSLQQQVDMLQGEIKELARLKGELLAPFPTEAGSAAAQAADSLDEHIDRQEQRSDVILDNRAAGAGP